MIRTNDINIHSVKEIIIPEKLKNEYPLSPGIAENVYRHRSVVRDIIAGRDQRLIGIVGPCSIHDEKAALEYAGRLKELSSKLKDKLYLIMRVYFEKPRTTIGWRGLITDPHLDGSYDINNGLSMARRIMLEIASIDLPIGSEVLDPIVPQYIADLISWSAIGARTTESQTHRQLASGLSMPVGFKNGTSGDLKLAVDAMESTCHQHSFIGIDQKGQTCILNTSGNPDVHIILRGGRSGPNYYEEYVEDAEDLMQKAGLRPAVMLDCSHANSGKTPDKQYRVLRSAIDQRGRGRNSIIGFMLESNLKTGSQAISDSMQYGVSITDPCIDWKTTEELLLYAHQNL